MKRILAMLLVVMMLCTLTGCLEGCTEAEKASYNLSKEADYFNCERRLTVYNARTDMMIFTIEGYFSLSNNSARELVITCKVGANEYKKNYVYLTENTLYVMEDITGTHVDPYHYTLTWHTEFPVEIETRP